MVLDGCLLELFKKEPFWVSAGIFYGYSPCCISSFVCGNNREILQNYKHDILGTGYVPCVDCVGKTKEQLLENIAAVRHSPLPFPEDGNCFELEDFFVSIVQKNVPPVERIELIADVNGIKHLTNKIFSLPQYFVRKNHNYYDMGGLLAYDFFFLHKSSFTKSIKSLKAGKIPKKFLEDVHYMSPLKNKVVPLSLEEFVYSLENCNVLR